MHVCIYCMHVIHICIYTFSATTMYVHVHIQIDCMHNYTCVLCTCILCMYIRMCTCILMYQNSWSTYDRQTRTTWRHISLNCPEWQTRRQLRPSTLTSSPSPASSQLSSPSYPPHRRPHGTQPLAPIAFSPIACCAHSWTNPR